MDVERRTQIEEQGLIVRSQLHAAATDLMGSPVDAKTHCQTRILLSRKETMVAAS